jgi:hypothetical protein
VQVLSLNGRAAIVAQSNDGCNNKLQTGLPDLKVHGISSRLVLRNHRSSVKLSRSLGEVDLEGQL